MMLYHAKAICSNNILKSKFIQKYVGKSLRCLNNTNGYFLSLHNHDKRTIWTDSRASRDKINNKPFIVRANSLSPITPFHIKSLNVTAQFQYRNHFTNTHTNNNSKMSTKTEFSRLPLNVLPVNYAVTLRPDLAKFTFDGEVTIDVEVKEATATVLLNSAELQFDRAQFTYADNTTVESSNVVLNEETEVATVSFSEPLRVGAGKLNVKYTGLLNDKLRGFYRSKYTNPAGEEAYAAVTQFEAADARRALPCWDEPAHKATFDVTIVADAKKTVLSNMPLVESTEVDGNLRRFVFDRTPKMSTYLLAFVVGEFEYIEDKDKNGILVRVYTPVGKTEFGRFALDVALKTLPFYTDYFDIGYPLPKLDLIAIADFAAGAMENWGLVTYRETTLLVDPKNSSLQSKEYVAIVVGHEIAHQWFGNLVTMEWWTHLWLNEGFASWIEYLCVDHCLPEFDIWTTFVTSDFTKALELDSLRNSHPIEVPVGPPSEVDEIFDAISYSKGASVIRMLHAYIGDDAFRKGLHNYLEKFKYGNALTEDLWEKLSEASQKPINELMELWTKQTGYPVVSVSREVNAAGHTVLKLNQQRFFSSGEQPTEEENYLWKIPVTVVTKSSFPNVHTRFLLEKRSDEVDLGVVAESDWIKLNDHSIGFYRTNYSTDMFDRLLSPINDKVFHPTDRAGLQSDAFALAFAGLLSTTDVLRFVESFSVEDNVTVWRELLGNLMHVSQLTLGQEYNQQLSSYVRKLVLPISKKLGWEVVQGESSLQSMCRATVLRTLGLTGDEETINEAKARFAKHLQGEHVPADLRSAVYAAVLVDADENTIKQFIDLHDSCDLQEEKMRLATSLGVVRNKDLLLKVLNFAVSPSVRSNNSVSVIGAVSNSVTNPDAREIAWTFIKDNWALLHERYQSGFLITRLIKTATEGFVTMDKYREVEEFFNQNPAPGAKRTIQQSLESIKRNAAWLERENNSLREYLKSF